MDLPDFHADSGDGKTPEVRLYEWATANLSYDTRIEMYRIVAEILIDGSRNLNREYMRDVIELAKLQAGELA